MKNPEVPSIEKLAEAYEVLLHKLEGGFQSDHLYTQLALWSRWSRLDARLFEIWISAVARNFDLLNPFLLWKSNRQFSFPSVMAVHLEFVEVSLEGPDVSSARRTEFQAWRQTVLYGVGKSPPQMFFVTDGRPRPQKSLAEISKSLKAFTAWGFFGAESPVALKTSRPTRRSRTELSPAQREQILAELIEKNEGDITVEMYMAAADHHIHRRTAERDLARSALLNRKGFTRARTYRQSVKSMSAVSNRLAPRLTDKDRKNVREKKDRKV